MAVDEALLQMAAKKYSPPTLRLYAWDPPCLSLGYAQKYSDINMDLLTSRGWTVVRRPTGGRAILHTDELTYSVTANQELPIVHGSVLESYRRLSSALLAALQELGVNASADKEYAQTSTTNTRQPVCFEVPSNYEITANGKKLVGSAQARKSGGVLQHGSLPLTGDIARIAQILSSQNEEDRQLTCERVLEHATTLADIIDKAIAWQTAALAFQHGFESVFDISFSPADLTPEEISLAESIRESKYAFTGWTFRI